LIAAPGGGYSNRRMAKTTTSASYINPQQAGGIESYVFADGEALGTRALLVNTGGGLRYRILPDRGLDIDQAFFNQHSLAFLTHKGVIRPTRAFDRQGLDWLKGFPGGLLTTCGPLNIGPPTTDQGETLGLHGTHSHTAATIESIIQADPRRGQNQMSVTAIIRYGQFYGPNVELRRTIASTPGGNAIDVTDDFVNPGNSEVPHAWLLHINFGYPLVDAGAELCFDATKVEPLDNEPARARFGDLAKAKKIPAPLDAHRGETSAVAYLFPKSDKQGRATVGIVNRKLGVGVAIRYSTREFPRCGNWQHFGPAGEYVTALEPMNGTIAGRDKDREAGLLDTLKPGARKTYRYTIEVVSDRASLEQIRALNG
jgi:hypothetical protein